MELMQHIAQDLGARMRNAPEGAIAVVAPTVC